MRLKFGVAALCVLMGAGADAQKPAADGTAVVAKRTPYFVDPFVFHAAWFVKPPPAQDSAVTRAELKEEHRIEATRTPQEIAAAQFDDQHEDIFLYATVLGSEFAAQGLPLTAALSAHIRNDSGVVNAPLKAMYKRPRPAQFDRTLHPVCKADSEASYPSGHTMVGYLMGLTLAEMVPEKHVEILQRADEYAHNRMVCGVHYASDLEASHLAAYAMFGYLLGTPRFQRELAGATEEVRHHLGLSKLPLDQ